MLKKWKLFSKLWNSYGGIVWVADFVWSEKLKKNAMAESDIQKICEKSSFLR